MSVQEVAVAAERAILDPALGSQIIQVGEPQHFTLNQLAKRGKTGKVRHIPGGPGRSEPFSRQARAAVVMDTIDMTFNAARPPGEQPLSEPLKALALRDVDQP